MPIYEYACPDCGHQFELIQKFSDDPARDCPACKGGNVKKLISLSAFQLTGSGWYKDHYGLKSGGGEAKTETKAETKSEAKPAAAAPAPAASTPKPAASS